MSKTRREKCKNCECCMICHEPEYHKNIIISYQECCCDCNNPEEELSDLITGFEGSEGSAANQ